MKAVVKMFEDSKLTLVTIEAVGGQNFKIGTFYALTPEAAKIMVPPVTGGNWMPALLKAPKQTVYVVRGGKTA